MNLPLTSFGLSALFLALLFYLSRLVNVKVKRFVFVKPAVNSKTKDVRRIDMNGNLVQLAKKTNKSDLRQLSREDLDIIDLNLLEGTIVNKLIEPEKMSQSIRNFLLHTKKLRHEVNEVLKLKTNNIHDVIRKPMKSRTIIYNRINKSGSSSLLCKYYLVYYSVE